MTKGPRAGVDAACGARAPRSGMDGGRLCVRQLAAGSPVTGRLDAFQWSAGGGAALRRGAAVDGRFEKHVANRTGPSFSSRRGSSSRGSRRRCPTAGTFRRARPGSACAGHRAGRWARRLPPRAARRADTPSRFPLQRHPHPSRPNRHPASRPPCSGHGRTVPKAVPTPIPAVIALVRAPTIPGSTTTASERELAGTDRHAQGPGRGLAGIFVTLGRQLGFVTAPESVFLANRGACPISGAGVSGSAPERCAWSAAIAQLVEHVIRNDGVTGSSPVCGTSLFNHFRPLRRISEEAPCRHCVCKPIAAVGVSSWMTPTPSAFSSRSPARRLCSSRRDGSGALSRIDS